MTKNILILWLLVFMPFVSVNAADKHSDKNSYNKMAIETLNIKTTAGKTYKFKIEIADTEQKRRHGLMGRKALPLKAGMLFVFDKTDYQEFWMKDTLVSLDIIFIDAAGRITKVHENATPEDLTPISSAAPVRAALEVKGGTAVNLNIKKGDLVQYKLFTK